MRVEEVRVLIDLDWLFFLGGERSRVYFGDYRFFVEVFMGG